MNSENPQYQIQSPWWSWLEIFSGTTFLLFFDFFIAEATRACENIIMRQSWNCTPNISDQFTELTFLILLFAGMISSIQVHTYIFQKRKPIQEVQKHRSVKLYRNSFVDINVYVLLPIASLILLLVFLYNNMSIFGIIFAVVAIFGYGEYISQHIKDTFDTLPPF
jgi:hypothetical protein